MKIRPFIVLILLGLLCGTSRAQAAPQSFDFNGHGFEFEAASFSGSTAVGTNALTIGRFATERGLGGFAYRVLEDFTGLGIALTLQLGPNNQASNFEVRLIDDKGDAAVFSFPASSFTTTGFTTVFLPDPTFSLGTPDVSQIRQLWFNGDFSSEDKLEVQLDHIVATDHFCGNSEVEPTEACDDGDLTNGDGCSDSCTIESGYSCTDDPSVCTPVCGDGLLKGSEQCDQGGGNVTNGDGCSSTCTIESGYGCSGSPSRCTLLCGNGTIDSGEQCDLGSTFNGQPDGCCSTTCTFKPATEACRPSAGLCDVVETCTGSSAACPDNTFAPSSQVCRPSTGALDPAESCPGNSATCPSDVVITGPVLTAVPGSLAGGGTVTVSWSNVTTPSSRDWVGVYREGALDTAYSAFKYVNCSQTPGVTALANGACTFQLSGTGRYEFRYFRNNGFTKIATSNVVTVGTVVTLPVVTIQATTPTATEGGGAGQFTISRTGSTVNPLTVTYTFTGSARGGDDFAAPTLSRTINSGATTATIDVLPRDDQDAEGNESVIVTLSADAAYTIGTPSTATVTLVDNEPVAGPVLVVSPDTSVLGGYVTVGWQGIPTPKGTDWIGVYPLGAGNGAYLAFQYVNCTANPGVTGRATGSCTFQMRRRGTFEFRYFPNNGLTPLVTSNPVTVP